MRNNAIPRKRYRNRHQKMYDALTQEYHHFKLKEREISKEDCEAIKNKIRKQMRRERRIATLKTIVLTLIIVVIILVVFLQNAHGQGIVSEDNRWNVLGMGTPGFIGTETYIIDGDSLVGDYHYKIIWMTFDSIDAYWTYQGLLREESNTVYYIPPGASEGILYDFNLEVGDTANIRNMFCYDTEVQVVIEIIDTVEYLGIARKRWHLEEDFGFPEFWIEGIGSNLGPLHTKYVMCIVCPTWELLCFHKNENLLYSLSPSNDCYIVNINEHDSQPNIEIFPNPARSKFEVRFLDFARNDNRSELVISKIELYDIMGRKVHELEFPPNTSQTEMDVSHLEPGSYFCRISMQDKSITKKILIR